ncbi:MAG TPA: alpha-glucosidase [Cytophagales bacterium]|jgi:hypothetical protein|nr:alpha-glucosidase [Cytophagales bacterium]
MKNLIKAFILLGMTSMYWACQPSGEGAFEPVTVKSPSETLELNFFLSESGRPGYMLYLKNQVVIDSSFLGLEFKNSAPLMENFEVLTVDIEGISETWERKWGETREVKNDYKHLKVSLKEKTADARLLNLSFKLYDDGLGFRYEAPEQNGLGEVEIMDEKTEFKLTGDHMSWWIPGDWEIYEHLYTKSLVSEVDAGAKRNNEFLAQTYIPDPDAVNTPYTMKTEDGIHISIHEANLTDYAGMTLHIDKENLTLSSALVAWEDGTKVKAKTPFVSPWRTIQVSPNAGGLIESNLIVNLNEPNKLDDLSYIEPMKYVGIWWEMHLGVSSWGMEGGKHGATTENAKRYIDFAAENGFGGVLIEGWNTGWEQWVGDEREGIFDWQTPYPDFDIDEVVAYGKEKDVQIIGHHETSGDVGNYDAMVEDAMAFYNEKGIHAVKTGYVGTLIPPTHYHHGQWMVNHYRKVVEVAAKNKIMVNAHEPIKATGIRRTYPNMIAREGLRGQEFNAWSDGNPPEHTLIIPFTRMLGGPIDFTPGIFNLKLSKLTGKVGMHEDRDTMFESEESYKPDNQVSTTLAKQLALYVVLYSPIQMAADLPQHYEGHPAFQFIRDVVVNWETSKIINGEVGEYITTVRKDRDSDDWFLGSITNIEPRDFEIALDFLDEGKAYQAIVYKDGADAHWDDNPQSYEIEEMEVKKGDQLNIKLAPGGGQAIYFKAK